MINGAILLEAINDIVLEKGIEKAIVLEGIKEGFQKAYEKFFDTEAKVVVEIDDQAGTLKMFQELTVVDNVEDDWLEIDLLGTQKLVGNKVKVGDVVKKEILFTEDFSRLAVLQMRQILQQKIKAAERAKIYAKFVDKEHEILRAKVTGMNEQGNSYLIDLDGTQSSLWNKKVIPGEKFKIDQYISVYVEEVAKESKFSQVMVSRTAPGFLAKLLEQEVPEISEGLIEVKGVAREPGQRAKVAVYSYDKNIDPIGSCIGVGGSRIRGISKELKDEKIDVILWSEDLAQYIMNAMAPVRVVSLKINEEKLNEETSKVDVVDVVVPTQQLSLAIGKQGVSARLVANLVQKRINIYSYDMALEKGIEILWNGNITLEEMNSPEFINNINNRRKPHPQTQTTFKNSESRNYYPQDTNVDMEALMELQQEIEKAQAQEVDDVYDEKAATDLKIKELPKQNFDLDEIQENLAAFEDLKDDFDSAADDPEDDEALIEDYEKYYD